MNTIAANQADRQIEHVAEDSSGNEQSRWSTNDELLVWTVSRIEGGRRHGVERDCHVVYGLSRGFFVEQTRKFRASAEQCIEMLQQGKRAGTTQRKVALDSIIAIRSDEDSGRLQIRTLNGTHQLEPISNEEADVLREIAAELVLRMPAGGASYADYSGPSYTERRRARDIEAAAAAELAERERQALVALENARVEDAPDAYEAPTYEVPVEALEAAIAPITEPGTAGSPAVEVAAEPLPESASYPETSTVEETTQAPHVDTPVTTMDLQRIAAAVHAEMGPESDAEAPSELPDDITVAGGVDITFEPAAEYNHAEVEVPPAAIPVMSEALLGYDPELDEIRPDGESDVGPLSQDVAAEKTEQFDRRQQRAIRRQMEGAVEPTPTMQQPAIHDHAATATNPSPSASLFEGYGGPEAAPALSFGSAADDDGINLPDGAVYQPADQAAEVAPAESAHLDLPAAAPVADFVSNPHAATSYGEGLAERRLVDDPNFPSVFDRRGAHPIVPVERPAWARFDDDDEETQAAESEVEVAEPPVLADGPPTLKAPTGGQPIGSGGAVGFNPDFDVNPFR